MGKQAGMGGRFEVRKTTKFDIDGEQIEAMYDPVIHYQPEPTLSAWVPTNAPISSFNPFFFDWMGTRKPLFYLMCFIFLFIRAWEDDTDLNDTNSKSNI